MDIFIVGGGLCGLATAISVTLSGHRATVFEAAEKQQEFGAGLQSSPNGTRLFQRWGLEQLLQPIATAPSLLEIRDFDGNPLARRRKYDDEIRQRYGHPLWTLHRVDLHDALSRRANELGVQIKFASRVATVNPAGARPSARLVNGDEYHGDLIIVADGVWSSLASQVIESPALSEPTGDMAYRIILHKSMVEDDEELSAWMRTPRIEIWIGPRAHAVAYSVRNGSQLNVVLLVKDDFEASAKAKGARRAGNVADLQRLFRGWDPILIKILEKVEHVDKWRLMSLPTLPTWRSPQGSCVLAGDCCHAILPYMAQGMNMGLEDAAALGSLLGHVETHDQIPQAIAMYERLRINRAAQMLEETRKHAKRWHTDDPEIQEQRNKDLRRSFQDNSDWTHPQQQSWIWSYDAYEEAEMAYRAEPFSTPVA